jgi:uncharacterized protein YciI/ketosteroid isomerase-like protein
MPLEPRQEMPPQVRAEAKTYAFVYAAGPQWIAGRPVTEQNLSAHRAYIGKLHAQGRLRCGGPFLDDEGGGLAVVRAAGRKEAAALLADDPAINDGVFIGSVRRWYPLFDETADLRAARSAAQINRCAVEALFDAVDRSDSAGVLAAYAETVTIHEAESLPYGGDYSGPDLPHHGQGYRAAWNRFQPNERRGLDPQILADGDHVVVLWRHKLENLKTGDSLDLPAVSVYRMENTKIIDSRMFHFDTAALLRFLEHNAERPASQAPEDVP